MTKLIKRMSIILAVVAALSMLVVGTAYAAAPDNSGSGDGVCDCVCGDQTRTCAGENGQNGNTEPGTCLCGQELQLGTGVDNGHKSYGEPGDGEGPGLNRMHQYGRS